MKVAIASKPTSLARLGAATLRLVFAQFAENRALATLAQTCSMSGCSLDEDHLRVVIKETIVPAYSHGWLPDIVTLKQLQLWVERRAALTLADPLLDVIGMKQYFLLHCLSSALDARKVSAQEVLAKCPAAGYIYADLLSDAVLDEWRPGASGVRNVIKNLDPKDGLRQWLTWATKSPDCVRQDELTLPGELQEDT